MKTKWFKTAICFAMGAILTMEVTSCSKDDENPTPIPNQKEAKIIMPASIEINIYGGHLHGPKKFHQNSFAKEVKYFGKNYKLKFTLENGKWVADPANEMVNLMGNTYGEEVHCVNAFDIHYYDKDGKEITTQYTTPENRKLYQHFFMAKNITSGYADTEKIEMKNGLDFMHYTYCDTDPADKSNHFDGAKFLENEECVGMKGYFEFMASYKKFNLEIRLMRANESKLVDGKPSPFYEPTGKQLESEEWLPAISIPINLYMSADDRELETKDFDDYDKMMGYTEADFTEKDRRIIHALMDAFGITDFKTAAMEFYWNIDGSGTHEMNNFWF